MKRMKYIKLAGASYNIKRFIHNNVKLPFKRVFVTIGNICYNIKFLCTKNIEIELINIMMDNTKLKSRVSRIFDNIDIDGIEDRIYSLENDMEDKQTEYQVEDIIYNQVGCVDDLATYDDINDVKDDIKEINKKLKIIIDEDLKVIEDKLVDNNDNTNNSIDNLIERDLLINECIKTIISRLDINENV